MIIFISDRDTKLYFVLFLYFILALTFGCTNVPPCVGFERWQFGGIDVHPLFCVIFLLYQTGFHNFQNPNILPLGNGVNHLLLNYVCPLL